MSPGYTLKYLRGTDSSKSVDTRKGSESFWKSWFAKKSKHYCTTPDATFSQISYYFIIPSNTE